jgi:hypothetical protein
MCIAVVKVSLKQTSNIETVKNLSNQDLDTQHLYCRVNFFYYFQFQVQHQLYRVSRRTGHSRRGLAQGQRLHRPLRARHGKVHQIIRLG